MGWGWGLGLPTSGVTAQKNQGRLPGRWGGRWSHLQRQKPKARLGRVSRRYMMPSKKEQERVGMARLRLGFSEARICALN